MNKTKKIFIVFSILTSALAFGSVDQVKRPFHSEVNRASPDFAHRNYDSGPISTREVFDRTQAVLRQLGVPQEPSYQSDLHALDKMQSQGGMEKLLPILDPNRQFHRFSTNGNLNLEGFQDFDSKQVEDFTVQLAPQETSINFLPLPPVSNSQKPLAGLRIALDPGHMGGDIWDVRTGKYITDHAGHKVSEGVINLQTALLLKNQLEAMGATVLVTHKTLSPVTTVAWEDLKISDYAPRELMAESLDPWFLDLIQSQPDGAKLYQAFKDNSNVQRLYKEDMRWQYYVLEADLDARAEIIKNFNPHLTLIIHYDADDSVDNSAGVSPVDHDYTKTYVAGGYQPEEFATRKDRAEFAQHLLNPAAFNSSFRLAKSVLTAIESDLQLKPDLGTAGNAFTIEPGIMARNLNLTRDLTNTAVAYVECLFYNDPREFQAFLAQDHEMDIGGVRTFYSNRLVQVTAALQKGLLDYVQLNRRSSSPSLQIRQSY